MNIQKKLPVEMANEICDLFDNLGFTSEKLVDTNDLIDQVTEIIENGTNHINEIIIGLKGEPLKIPNITVVESECGCFNLPPDPYERQPGE